MYTFFPLLAAAAAFVKSFLLLCLLPATSLFYFKINLSVHV